MFKNLFKKDETPEEKLRRELEKAQKETDKKNDKLVQRQKKTAECYAVLAECYRTFEKTIVLENSRVYELQSMGFDSNDQRARVREAAIGMLVAKEAMIKMERISTDEELNSAMNKMGMALKQVQRLDDSSSAISESTRRTLRKWYPYPLEENEADKEMNAKLEIPEEIRDRIDDSFITKLMNGVGFEACLLESRYKKPETRSQVQSSLDAGMDAIARYLPDEDKRADKKALEDKFGSPF